MPDLMMRERQGYDACHRRQISYLTAIDATLFLAHVVQSHRLTIVINLLDETEMKVDGQRQDRHQVEQAKGHEENLQISQPSTRKHTQSHVHQPMAEKDVMQRTGPTRAFLHCGLFGSVGGQCQPY